MVGEDGNNSSDIIMNNEVAKAVSANNKHLEDKVTRLFSHMRKEIIKEVTEVMNQGLKRMQDHC